MIRANRGTYALSCALLLTFDASLGEDGKGFGGKVTVPVKGQSRVVYRESHALVVGIDRYPDRSAFRSLTFAVSDADAVRDLLVKVYGFPEENVTLLTDKTRRKPTRQAILQGLTRLSQVRGRDARVVFYFSGHGQTADVWTGKRGFLVPADANIPRNDVANAGLLDAKCVAMAQVKDKLTICQARHRLLLLDACFSGLAISGKSALRPTVPDYLCKVAFSPVLKVFVAGQAGEEVFEKPEWGHGAFTKRMLEVLTPNDAGAVIADMNGDGYVTTDELWSLVPTRVREMTRGRQNPKDAQEGDGELLFVPPKMIRLPEPKVGAIEVRCNVTGANVSVDGRGIGTTRRGAPLTVRDLTAGFHTVLASLPGHKGWRKDVFVSEGQTERAIVVLEPREPVGPQAGQVRANSSDGAQMVYVPAGEFLMGADEADNQRIWKQFGWSEDLMKYAKDEAPKHRVQVDGFWMYRYEVTVRQFQKFVEATGHKTEAEKEGKGAHFDPDQNKYVWVDGLSWRHPFEKDVPAKPDHAVVQVSWDDAQAYCRWAGVRLPTEAEWEYAARGGNTGLAGKPRLAFVWGDDAPRRAVANMWDEAAARKYPKTNFLKFANYDDAHALTAPVGTYAPNGFGLFDTAGNVYEWCSDWYGEDYYGQSPSQNPKGPSSGKYRVVRGGAWDDSPNFLRVSFRYWLLPLNRRTFYGFRCARTP